MSLWLFGLGMLAIWLVSAVVLVLRADSRAKESSRPEAAKAMDGAVHYIRNLSRTLTLVTAGCFAFIWLAGISFLPASLVLHTFEALRFYRERLGQIGEIWTMIGIAILVIGLLATSVRASKVAKVLNSKGLFDTLTKPSKAMTVAATFLLVPALIGMAEGHDLDSRLSVSAARAEVTLNKEKLEKELTALNPPPDDLTADEQAQIHSIAQHITYKLRAAELPKASQAQVSKCFKERSDYARTAVIKEAAVTNETKLSNFHTPSAWEAEVQETVRDDVRAPAPQEPVEPDIKPVEEALKAKARIDKGFREKLHDFVASFHEETPFNERFSELIGRVVENRLGVALGEEPSSYIGGMAEEAGIYENVSRFVEDHKDSSERFYNRSRARVYKAAVGIAEGEDLHKIVADLAGPAGAVIPVDPESTDLLSKSVEDARIDPAINPMTGKIDTAPPAIEPDLNPGGGGGGGGGGSAGESEAVVREKATYSQLFPASEEAAQEVASALPEAAGEIESVGSALARDFSMLAGAGEVGGVLIGRSADGGGQMSIDDIGWEAVDGDASLIRIVLRDHDGSVHKSTPYHRETVWRALAYAADGRPVTYTKPLIDRSHRIDAVHPALLKSDLSEEMDIVDTLTDKYTAESYAPRSDAEIFFEVEKVYLDAMHGAKTGSSESKEPDHGLERMKRGYVAAIEKMNASELSEFGVLISNPESMGTDKRSFLYGRLNLNTHDVPYGADLIGNIEDVAPGAATLTDRAAIAEAFEREFDQISKLYSNEREAMYSELSFLESASYLSEDEKVRRVKPLVRWFQASSPRPESGVRELPFKLDYDNLLMQADVPPVDVEFVLVNVFDDGRQNPNPFNFPLIADELNQTVLQTILNGNQRTAGKSDLTVFRDVCEFTILQRLFRAGFDGRLGYDFPVEKLAELTKISRGS